MTISDTPTRNPAGAVTFLKLRNDISQTHTYTHTRERAHKTFLTALPLFLQNVTARVDIINCHGLIPLTPPPSPSPTPLLLSLYMPSSLTLISLGVKPVSGLFICDSYTATAGTTESTEHTRTHAHIHTPSSTWRHSFIVGVLQQPTH